MKTSLFLLFSVFSLSILAQDYNYTLNGNLGVGTNPEHKLDVNGDSKMDGDLIVTDRADLQGDVKISNLTVGASGEILMIDENGIVHKMPPSVFQQMVYKGDPGNDCPPTYEPIWENTAGVLFTGWPCESSVGINTKTPEFSLDVVGDIRTSDRLHIGGGTSTIGKLNVNAENNDGFLLEQATSSNKYSLRVQNNGIETFNLSSNGSLLMRLTEADQDLFSAFKISNMDNEAVFHVSSGGHVSCKKLIVKLDIFPDYVFEKDYRLMSLYDLEKYIKENKHLPNMPSSTEVSENGGDIGEINRVLVEKVEELTLHVIALQKQLDALKD